MIIKEQKQIHFINDCECVFDEAELSNAILWYQHKPTKHLKHIYMHGKYPAVSVHDEKLHIHRLLMLYWCNGVIPETMLVHHKNGNKKDATRNNLTLIDIRTHQSMHNKGKHPSKKTINATIASNHSRKGCRYPHRRKEITPQMVYELKEQGLSFNQISLKLNMDWGCVKQRYNDFIHDNPELMKGGVVK